MWRVWCEIFTPAVRIKEGDDFEVVLSGLTDQETPKGVRCPDSKDY